MRKWRTGKIWKFKLEGYENKFKNLKREENGKFFPSMKIPVKISNETFIFPRMEKVVIFYVAIKAKFSTNFF